jgi:hypothetical protein
VASALPSAVDLYESSEGRRIFNEHRRYAAPVAPVRLVEENFRLRQCDWARLFMYTTEPPGIIPVLAEAPAAIRDVFGQGARPFLDIVNDPEEDWEMLFVTIPTAELPDVALDLLERLDAEWFADAARRCAFRMMVTVETTLVVKMAVRFLRELR